jgi:hypothetical protein
MRSLRSGRQRISRGLGGALLGSACALATACGSGSAPHTFHPAANPAGGASADPSSSPTAAPQASGTAAGTTLTVPPFGQNAHIAMTSWLPAQRSEIPAVIAAKNFLLAVLYADYTGDRDHRWTGYAAPGPVRSGLARTLAQPGITTESFTGTIRLWRMHALKTGPGPKGSIEVFECIDNSHARNTGLSSGKVLPKRLQTPKNQNYYLNSDVLARSSTGHWQVISIPAAVYYPQAQECKP